MQAAPSPRHQALTARLQTLLGSPHLGVLHELSAQLGSSQGTHYVSLGDDRIIAVVLSNATEVHDRGAGWHASQDIVTLQEYLLVDQRLALVERYWRRDGHSWWYRSYEAGETVTLSTGHVLSIDALYDGVLDLPGEVAELRETLTEASDRLLAVAAWLRERAK